MDLLSPNQRKCSFDHVAQHELYYTAVPTVVVCSSSKRICCCLSTSVSSLVGSVPRVRYATVGALVLLELGTLSIEAAMAVTSGGRPGGAGLVGGGRVAVVAALLEAASSANVILLVAVGIGALYPMVRLKFRGGLKGSLPDVSFTQFVWLLV